MDTAFNTVLILVTILETVLVIAYARLFTRGAEGLGRIARPLLIATAAAYLGLIALRSIEVGACPLGTWEESMAVVAFAITVTYLILELRIGDSSTGVFVITPAFVLHLVAAIALLERGEPAPSRLGVALSFHVFAAVVGSSAAVVCGVYSVLYLFLYAAIKTDRYGLFFRKIPSLDVLSRLNRAAAAVAFIALTVALGLGSWAFRGGAGGRVSLLQPTVILTLVLWVLYGGSLLGSRLLGLGGKRFAYTTLTGSLALVGLFIWVAVRSGFHG